MRMPKRPPAMEKLLRDRDSWSDLLAAVDGWDGPTYLGRYVHWDKLRYMPLPEGLTAESLWLRLKISRAGARQEVPLADAEGRRFSYSPIGAVF